MHCGILRHGPATNTRRKMGLTTTGGPVGLADDKPYKKGRDGAFTPARISPKDSQVTRHKKQGGPTTLLNRGPSNKCAATGRVIGPTNKNRSATPRGAATKNGNLIGKSRGQNRGGFTANYSFRAASLRSTYFGKTATTYQRCQSRATARDHSRTAIGVIRRADCRYSRSADGTASAGKNSGKPARDCHAHFCVAFQEWKSFFLMEK